jgi:hypothetical protein
MHRHRSDEHYYIIRLKEAFRLAAGRALSLFGDSAFRVIGRDGRRLEKNVNRALYDAEMLACGWLTSDPMKEDSTAVFRAVGELCEDPRFQDSIRRATGDRSRTLTRIRMMVTAFKRAGLRVAGPEFLE